MRPINKGDCPQINGVNVNYTDYSQAKPELINRIGDYCSYCENQITNPAIEHIQPKSLMPGVALNWDNFLLACINCNSIKGHSLININDYYWPDIHNTNLIFDFHPCGAITIKNVLHQSANLRIVQNTMELTGLERYGSTVASDSDRRWIKRSQAWGKASDALNYYEENNQPLHYILSITNTATSTGFWSVWMKVFENHQEVKVALIQSFEGTFDQIQTTDINRN